MAATPRPASDPPPIDYAIGVADADAHLFEVECTVVDPDPEGQLFALPAWNPGSYMVREFARHVVSARARSGSRPIGLHKIDKHTWLAARSAGPITVTLRVYAWDLSVRGAHLDRSHAFFNGACVFLRPIGRQGRECRLEIRRPRGAGFRDWRVATSMPRLDAPELGFGRYRAANYDELIDHPVEIGRFSLARFRAAGVPHRVAITGVHDADPRRLARDLRRICEAQIELFGRPAPMREYLFLITAVDEGYGGLEHRASTALLCRRAQLPRAGEPAAGEAYRELLGLASHEYFHTWNVKRIRPAAFTPYDLDRENYTTLLWAFEGFTSYYDDLMLVRAGILSRAEYLGILARSITAYARLPARRVQSAAESSFDAWIKYYRQDENAPNAVVSYYAKGSLIALGLDLLIREATGGRRSLDDLMRHLWRRHGRAGAGVPEDGVERALEEVLQRVGPAGTARGRRGASAAARARAFLRRSVYGTGELPLGPILRQAGIAQAWRHAAAAGDRGGFTAAPAPAPGRPRIDPGLRLSAEGEARVVNVLNGGAAERAGIAAGDLLMAIDGLRITARNADALIQRRSPGTTMTVHFFRRDELHSTSLVAARSRPDTCELSLAERRPGPVLRAWLRGARA